MKLLTLVTSKRRKGNSAITAKLIEKLASKYEITASTEYLDDYEILECDGCMSCVFKNKRCHLDDDFYSLIEKISSNDLFIIIAPTYVLSIPGALKTFLDRFLLFLPYYQGNYGKQGGSIGISSLSDWQHFELPFLNIILLSLGFSVADSFMLYGAGPGEVLLNNNIEKIVEDMLLKLLNKEDLNDSVVSDECPVCHSRIFEYSDGGFICPFCRIKAKRRDDGFLFELNEIRNHRFTKMKIEDHFAGWIMGTKDMFRKNLREVLKKKKEILEGCDGT